MAQTALAPILELDTVTDRPKIKIDGKEYEMRTADEFAYLVYRRQHRQFIQLGNLIRKKRPTQADEREQTRLLDKFVRELLIAPDAVHARLRDTHRMSIVQSFSFRLPTTTQPAAGSLTRKKKRAGAK